MPCSASSTDRIRHERVAETSRPTKRSERAVARLLVAALLVSSPGTALGGEEFSQADAAEMLTPGSIDNGVAGETTITSFVDDGLTRWTAGLEQPAGHSLVFDLAGEAATHTNIVGGDFAAHLNGQIVSGANDTIVFASPYGVFVGAEAQIDVGSLVAAGADLTNPDRPGRDGLSLTGPVVNQGTILANQDVLLYGSQVLNTGQILTPAGRLLMLGGDALFFLGAPTIAEGLLNPVDFVALLGEGRVLNAGELQAGHATLLARHVANQGTIDIEDGTLMMLGADAVYLRRFDDPVLIRLPHATEGPANGVEDPNYAVENEGRIDAGTGHVRLAAADALGWGLRQHAEGSIHARKIELAGGEGARVDLSGEVLAQGEAPGETGGQIDVSGGIVTLRAARLDASGDAGGGTIHLGGEEKGGGNLPRARAVAIDSASQARADALRQGDGGRVIVFAEDLASVRGALSARGGAEGGDGGFVETSGLRHLDLTTVPDLGADEGEAGEWLIDPYSISIVDPGTATDCLGAGESCLDRAVEQILAPNFDSAEFDGVLRTVSAQTAGVAAPNELDVDLLVRALAVGTDVTLSTEAFQSDDDDLSGAGDIRLDSALSIPDGAVIPGTRATLTLLAAGNIELNQAISVGDGDRESTPDMALSLVLTANDQAQRDPTRDFGEDQLLGGVTIGANVRTGGGDFTATGISVEQTAQGPDGLPNVLETDGGDVTLSSGSYDRFGREAAFTREPDSVDVAAAPTPKVQIAGEIDTTRPQDDGGTGGALSVNANAVLVQTTQSGDDDLLIHTARLIASGTLTTGGGAIELIAGNTATSSTGSVELQGATLDSAGGDVRIESRRVDPVTSDVGAFEVRFVDDTEEGGRIDLDLADGGGIDTAGGALSIGSEDTQQVAIDGTIDTTGGAFGEAGSLSIIATDAAGVSETGTALAYGSGAVSIGAIAETRIDALSIAIDTRALTIGEEGGAHAVTLATSGVTNEVAPIVDEENTALIADAGEISIRAGREVTLRRNTRLNAEQIEISAAASPTLLNEGETRELTRLHFEGDTLAGDASRGVRLEADEIAFTVGDGATSTPDLEYDDPGTEAEPTDFGLQRGTRGEFAGLQLRSRDGGARPSSISIVQDADLVVDDGSSGTDTALYFGARSGATAADGIFGDAEIGAEGQEITLASRDGSVTIRDTAGLNDAVVTGPGEIGTSRITLDGGLLLPDAAGTAPGNAVAFELAGGAPFEVTGLSVSSPRSLTLSTEVVGAIGSVDELRFEAGRADQTGSSDAEARGGALELDSGVVVVAADSLSLHAGASGWGDLVFSTGTANELRADAIALRAGGGTDSQNTGPNDTRSQVSNASGVAFRSSDGSAFESRPADDSKSFSLRQDAAIDAGTHLPTLASFGLDDSFGTSGTPVEYSIRSDAGNVDLTAWGADASPVRDTILSLVGTDFEGEGPIEIAEGFQFVGPELTLGGLGNFVYTAELAEAFASSEAGRTVRDRLTLRAGLAETGSLRFDSDVVVRSPRIELVAGDGEGGDFGSSVRTAGATFDLRDAGAGPRTFVFQEDDNFELTDLPDRESQFAGDVLPTILALRNDSGFLDLTNPDFTSLPLDLTTAGTEGRLILEADSISLQATRGADLALTATVPDPDSSDPLANLKLRIRGNAIDLRADDGSEDNAGSILLGQRSGDAAGPLAEGDDASFDAESILIEEFDLDADIATTTNFGSSSVVEGSCGGGPCYDPARGRGPSNFAFVQDATIGDDPDTPATIEPSELPNRYDFAGYLARGNQDDDDDELRATRYFLLSEFGDVTISAENVSGSRLEIGSLTSLKKGDVTFRGGEAYDFENLFVFTEGSIHVGEAADLSVDGTLQLEAGALLSEPNTVFVAPDPSIPGDEGTVMGRLSFEGNGLTDLEGQTIILSAGTPFRLTNPDADRDGEPDEIDPAALARIDWGGLGSIRRPAVATRESLVSVSQNASLDTDLLVQAIRAGDDGEGDQWDSIVFASVQGETRIADLDDLGRATRSLTVGDTSIDATTVFDLDGDAAAPFANASGDAGFERGVLIESNDVTFRRTDGVELQLDSPTLEIASSTLRSGFEPDEELNRIFSDPDKLERPLVRIDQANVDFGGTTLPRADAYTRFGILPGGTEISRFGRDSLEGIDLRLRTTGGAFILNDEIRDGAASSNLSIQSCGSGGFQACGEGGGNLSIALTSLTSGYDTYDFATPDIDVLDFAALPFASAEFTGFDEIAVRPFTPTLPSGTAGPVDLTIETLGDQLYEARLVLESTLAPTGRDMRFAGPIYRFTGAAGPGDDAPIDAGLFLETSGDVRFEGDLGTASQASTGIPEERLGSLWVVFDSGTPDRTPSVTFDSENDDQFVYVEGETVFVSANLDQPNDPTDPEDGNRVALLRDAVTSASTLGELEAAFSALEVGRRRVPGIATVGRGEGGLSFQSAGNGDFVMSSGERLSVGGALEIDHDGDLVTLGDAAALSIEVSGSEVGLVRRRGGSTRLANGSSAQDAGSSIVSNETLDFGGLTPQPIGPGRQPNFGVRDPFDPNLPSFLQNFSVVANRPENGALDASDFRFEDADLVDSVPSILPNGASRSELTGALGPFVLPTPTAPAQDLPLLAHPERLLELDVEARPTTEAIRVARLEGAAVIDDLDLVSSGEAIAVTGARLDAQDAEDAIELYESLFGPDGGRAGELRLVLQEALDRYLETTRARRVIGFELRRFVKNRPSTLLAAYTTLDRLDTLFRLHRRLGLSPGEFRTIQSKWLAEIQPEGISLSELSEAIHPSRYVRGSDILDIFGR